MARAAPPCKTAAEGGSLHTVARAALRRAERGRGGSLHGGTCGPAVQNAAGAARSTVARAAPPCRTRPGRLAPRWHVRPRRARPRPRAARSTPWHERPSAVQNRGRGRRAPHRGTCGLRRVESRPRAARSTVARAALRRAESRPRAARSTPWHVRPPPCRTAAKGGSLHAVARAALRRAESRPGAARSTTITRATAARASARRRPPRSPTEHPRPPGNRTCRRR